MQATYRMPPKRQKVAQKSKTAGPTTMFRFEIMKADDVPRGWERIVEEPGTSEAGAKSTLTAAIRRRLNAERRIKLPLSWKIDLRPLAPIRPAAH